jgi:hypothetical protein
MKVYINEKYIARRASIGKYASILGLVILATLALIGPTRFWHRH